MGKKKRIFKQIDLIYRPSEIINHILKYGEAIVKERDFMIKFIKKGNSIHSYTIIKTVITSEKAKSLARAFRTPLVRVFFISFHVRNTKRNPNVDAFRKWFDKKISELINKAILFEISKRFYMCVEPEVCEELIKEVIDKINNYYQLSEDDIKFIYMKALVNIETILQYM